MRDGKYRDIDLSQIALYHVSEDCAKALIDWRAQIKKPMNQRIFDNALKQAVECSMYDMTAEEALDRWMESGWTGMKWVLAEAKREGQGSTRQRSLREDLTDTSWAKH
jgi:hypothetical protein